MKTKQMKRKLKMKFNLADREKYLTALAELFSDDIKKEIESESLNEREDDKVLRIVSRSTSE